MSDRCCSARSAGSCAGASRAAISKREDLMIGRRALLVTVLLAAVAHPAAAQDKVKVVATFSILADLVKNVGGDRVEVAALVGPNGDAHVYAPTPTDAKTLAAARLVVANGFGFEGWIDRLVKASGTKAAMVVATTGVK